MDIENAKTTESINNFIKKYYYSTNANKKYFDTQYNKMKNKIYHEYGNDISKYKFNTLLKYLSEDFGVKHIKDDNQLIDNLSKKMIIIHDAPKNVPLPTFDELIEKIKQNEKSRRTRKNENKSDEEYNDDDDNQEEEEINFT